MRLSSCIIIFYFLKKMILTKKISIYFFQMFGSWEDILINLQRFCVKEGEKRKIMNSRSRFKTSYYIYIYMVSGSLIKRLRARTLKNIKQILILTFQIYIYHILFSHIYISRKPINQSLTNFILLFLSQFLILFRARPVFKPYSSIPLARSSSA